MKAASGMDAAANHGEMATPNGRGSTCGAKTPAWEPQAATHVAATPPYPLASPPPPVRAVAAAG